MADSRHHQSSILAQSRRRNYQGLILHISGESVSKTTNLIEYWLRLIAAVLVAWTMVLATQAVAQDGKPQPSDSGVLAEQQTILDGLTAQVDQADKDVVANANNDLRLVEIRLSLEEILSKALASGVAFRPRIIEINNRLEQIGPPPGKDGFGEHGHGFCRAVAVFRSILRASSSV